MNKISDKELNALADEGTQEISSMDIRFYRKDVYGNELIYPVDYQLELFQLTGQKTLSPKQIRALESMGFRFREVLKPVKEPRR